MKKLIRDIDFGPVVGASGVQGFFGEGYPHHVTMKKWVPGFDFNGMGFVAKTVTLESRLGNMHLRHDGLTPKEGRPDCIRWNFLAGAVLNAVGLSNFGADYYFRQGRWQQRTQPFQLSFMSVGNTFEDKRAEFKAFVRMLRQYLHTMRAPIALQVNYTCPNTGHTVNSSKSEELTAAIRLDMEVAHDLNAAFIPKLNVLISPELVVKISEYDRCDAISMSNTVPWGELPDQIDWEGLFGSKESPLAHYVGGGGLSGSPITKIVRNWVYHYNRYNWKKPLIAGGGVMRARDARHLLNFDCVHSVSIGTAAILRPWRLQSIIHAAHAMRN